jgi:hypothetical protein
VESDSLELTQACNGTSEAWNHYRAILAEYFLKAINIENISFQHCPREANQVVKFSYETKESWDGDPPGFILPFISHDVTLPSIK